MDVRFGSARDHKAVLLSQCTFCNTKPQPKPKERTVRTKTIRLIAALAGSVTVTVLSAAPATAAPGDVTHSLTTTGTTVTDTFVNNSAELVECRSSALRTPFDPGLNNDNDYAYSVEYSVLPGDSASYTTPGQFPLVFGERLFIEWACYTPGYREVWGTSLVNTLDKPTGIPYQPTASTAVVVVGVGVVPEPPVETCTGSACLPTGSFGS